MVSTVALQASSTVSTTVGSTKILKIDQKLLYLQKRKFFEINKISFSRLPRLVGVGTETKSATKYKIAASAGVLNGISEQGVSNLISHQLQMCEV